MDYRQRLEEALATYEAAMVRVKTTPAPVEQKFAIGARVWIMKDLGPCTRHFPAGCMATVHHTYAHAFGGNDIKRYCLDVDGHGLVAWYFEHQLSLPFSIRDVGPQLPTEEQARITKEYLK